MMVDTRYDTLPKSRPPTRRPNAPTASNNNTTNAEAATDKESQGRAALEARAVLAELIDAAASNELERLDAAISKERARHPDLQDEATVLRQYKDGNGRTALHFAAHAGQTEVGLGFA